jgi:hypothetical protein
MFLVICYITVLCLGVYTSMFILYSDFFRTLPEHILNIKKSIHNT